MTDETQRVVGGCMCGAVRYEAIGKPLYVGHCHCHSCRHHTGAPVVTFVVFDVDKIRFTHGERSIYNSSPGVGRGFCSQCGTPLTWEGNAWERDIVEFHISTLDDPDIHAPDRHWFYDERIAWFDVADGLPRYEGQDEWDEHPGRSLVWMSASGRFPPIAAQQSAPIFSFCPTAGMSTGYVKTRKIKELLGQHYTTLISRNNFCY